MTTADIDREESRSARLAAERDNDPHPQDCCCRPCLIDWSGFQPGQYDDGHAVTALLLTVAFVLGFVGLVLLGQTAMCTAHQGLSYCHEDTR